MDLNLRGKLALVTGASKGIGLACARQLAEEGCHLHLASRTKADLERAKETIQSRHNVSVTIHAVDLSKGDAVRSLASACGDIDILVNNAGAIPAGDLQAIDEARWRAAWDLKVFGYINLCRAVYPALKAKRRRRHRQRARRRRRTADLGLHRRQRRQCLADGLHPRHGRHQPRRPASASSPAIPA